MDRGCPQRKGERRGDDAGRKQDRPQGAAAGAFVAAAAPAATQYFAADTVTCTFVSDSEPSRRWPRSQVADGCTTEGGEMGAWAACVQP